MGKTRVIIEGEGVTPFPSTLLGCKYCSREGVAAWIGLSIQDQSGGDGFPWTGKHFKTQEESGLFPETGQIKVTVEHEGEVVSEFTCPVSPYGEWASDEEGYEDDEWH